MMCRKVNEKFDGLCCFLLKTYGDKHPKKIYAQQRVYIQIDSRWVKHAYMPMYTESHTHINKHAQPPLTLKPGARRVSL